MELKIRELMGSFSQAARERLGKLSVHKKNAPDVIDAEDVRITEITTVEQMVNERTREVEEARDQLRRLANAYSAGQRNDDTIVKGALVDLLDAAPEAEKAAPPLAEELKIEDSPAPLVVENELVVQKVKVSAEETDGLELASAPAEEPLAKSKLAEGVGVTPGGLAAASPRQAAGGAPQIDLSKITLAEEKKTKADQAGAMISDIFDKEEEESNPLASLMGSLPDASINDIMDEARELKAMLAEWAQ